MLAGDLCEDVIGFESSKTCAVDVGYGINNEDKSPTLLDAPRFLRLSSRPMRAPILGHILHSLIMQTWNLTRGENMLLSAPGMSSMRSARDHLFSPLRKDRDPTLG